MWHSCVWEKENNMGCIHKLRSHKRTLTEDLTKLNLKKSWKKYDMSRSLQNMCQINYIARSMKFELIDSYLDWFITYLVYEHHASVFSSSQVWLPCFFLCWLSHMFFSLKLAYPNSSFQRFASCLGESNMWFYNYTIVKTCWIFVLIKLDSDSIRFLLH